MVHTNTQSQELITLEKQYNANNYKPLDVVLTRGEGIWVWDVDGKRYLDFLSAYSAVNQGHANPRILKAMIDQASRLPLTSRAFHNDQLPKFAKQICELLGYDKMLPMNSGAEAVESAIKLARKWGYKVKGVADGQAEIIVCTGNFAGRTTTNIKTDSDRSRPDLNLCHLVMLTL
jgi:ornithine--oxo-acid transaminase